MRAAGAGRGRELALPLSTGRPHEAMAFCPSHSKVLRTMLALRLYPERKTALESSFVKSELAIVTFSVPSRNTAPIRSKAQSPPDGLDRGSMNDGRFAVNVRLLNAMSVTGVSCEPTTSKRLIKVGIMMFDGGCVPFALRYSCWVTLSNQNSFPESRSLRHVHPAKEIVRGKWSSQLERSDPECRARSKYTKPNR